MRKRSVLWMAIALLLFGSPAGAADNSVSLGLRAGYGVPAGSVLKEAPITDFMSGQIPLWIDAGYRFSPAVYVGGYFSYGLGRTDNNKLLICTEADSACSGSVLRFGVNAHLHLLPRSTVDPWLGAGLGYEKMQVEAKGEHKDKEGWEGFDLANIQAGCDYRPSQSFGIGPWAMVSLARYVRRTSVDHNGDDVTNSISNQRMHQWFMIGVRGVYDIRL